MKEIKENRAVSFQQLTQQLRWLKLLARGDTDKFCAAIFSFLGHDQEEDAFC